MTRNVWHHEAVNIPFPSCPEGDSANCQVPVGPSSFHVLPKGQNILVLEVGELDPYTQVLRLSSLPSWIVLPVGKSVRGLEFLAATELGTRLTGVQVGEIELRYAMGNDGHEPLVYGRNIDCFLSPFATETTNYDIAHVGHLSAFVVETDPARKLEAIEIHLNAVDATVGILAMNLVLPQ
jgi:hypothetical protein